MGKSILFDQRSTELKKGLEMLGDHFKLFNDKVIEIFNDINTYNSFDLYTDNVFLNMIDGILGGITSLFNYVIVNNAFIGWEEMLLQLRAAYLPFNLIPWIKLKNMLNDIRASLPRNYQLAITETQWQDCYILPITKFMAHEEKIIIRLTIPLYIQNLLHDDVMYRIITPSAAPVPCDSSLCAWYDNFTNNSHVIEFDLTDNSWLVSLSENYVKAETNLATWDCTPIGTKH